jgi:hypothetical protein
MRTPEFSDPAIHAAVRAMGGWRRVCFPSEAETWQRKRFLEVYEVMQSRETLELPAPAAPAPRFLPNPEEKSAPPEDLLQQIRRASMESKASRRRGPKNGDIEAERDRQLADLSDG